MEREKQLLLDALARSEGCLALAEDSNEAEIKRQTGLEKNAFLQVIKQLVEEEKIQIEGGEIKALETPGEVRVFRKIRRKRR